MFLQKGVLQVDAPFLSFFSAEAPTNGVAV